VCYDSEEENSEEERREM